MTLIVPKDLGSSLRNNDIGMWAGYIYLSLVQARVIWEEGISIHKIPTPAWPVIPFFIDV